MLLSAEKHISTVSIVATLIAGIFYCGGKRLGFRIRIHCRATHHDVQKLHESPHDLDVGELSVTLPLRTEGAGVLLMPLWRPNGKVVCISQELESTLHGYTYIRCIRTCIHTQTHVPTRICIVNRYGYPIDTSTLDI